MDNPPPAHSPPPATRPMPTIPYLSIVVAAHRRPSHPFLISMRPQQAHTPTKPMLSYSLSWFWAKHSFESLHSLHFTLTHRLPWRARWVMLVNSPPPDKPSTFLMHLHFVWTRRAMDTHARSICSPPEGACAPRLQTAAHTSTYTW